MSRPQTAAQTPAPASSPSPVPAHLPPRYTPKVAGYARGPFIEPQAVTPTDWTWRNARTFIVQDSSGQDYRCVRVHSEGAFVGYWAVELLGLPLPLTEWE